jgi:hypothetical protein
VNEERSILNMAREREYANNYKSGPVKRYFITGKELEYYRNLEVPDETMDAGGGIVLGLLERRNLLYGQR